jgi:YcxB-like protein
MTASSIAFEGTVSEPLFLRAQSLYAGRRRLLFVLFAAAFTVGIWVTFSELPFLSKVLATVAAVSFVPLLPVIQRRQWKRLYNRTPYLLDPIRGEVSEWGLRAEGSMGKSEVPWPKFVKYEMDDGLILLYQGPNVFQLIAAEFFATRDDWIEARKIIVERSGLKPR